MDQELDRLDTPYTSLSEFYPTIEGKRVMCICGKGLIYMQKRKQTHLEFDDDGIEIPFYQEMCTGCAEPSPYALKT